MHDKLTALLLLNSLLLSIYTTCATRLGAVSHILKRWDISHKTLLNFGSPLPSFVHWNTSKHGGYPSLRKTLTVFFSVQLLAISMKQESGFLLPDERQSWA